MDWTTMKETLQAALEGFFVALMLAIVLMAVVAAGLEVYDTTIISCENLCNHK